jgi:hypothetical protein
MVWPSTVATGLLGFAASELWAKDVAVMKRQLSNRNVAWPVNGNLVFI